MPVFRIVYQYWLWSLVFCQDFELYAGSYADRLWTVTQMKEHIVNTADPTDVKYVSMAYIERLYLLLVWVSSESLNAAASIVQNTADRFYQLHSQMHKACLTTSNDLSSDSSSWTIGFQCSVRWQIWRYGIVSWTSWFSRWKRFPVMPWVAVVQARRYKHLDLSLLYWQTETALQCTRMLLHSWLTNRQTPPRARFTNVDQTSVQLNQVQRWS